MSPLDKARKRHLDLLDPLNSIPDPADYAIRSAIGLIEQYLRLPGIQPRQIKRARSAKSYLRLILK
jgi:hypothetical protein